MIRLFLLLAMGYSVTQFYQYNNFDEPDPTLPIVLDSLNVNNSWQIAAPNKTVFDWAYSSPNVLITDSLATYSVNDSSSFTIELDSYFFWGGLPFIVVQWQQWLDTEQNLDGAVVEYAFETPDHWINVFKDTLTRPWAMIEAMPDTLFNGQVGFSGTNEVWKSVGFCWSEAYIAEPIDKMFLRFTFYSDSLDTQQDGWMIDHIEAFPTFIDYTTELRSLQSLALNVFPNPAAEIININWTIEATEATEIPTQIELMNLSGVQLRAANITPTQNQISWEIADLPAGIYIIYLQSKHGPLVTQRFVKS